MKSTYQKNKSDLMDSIWLCDAFSKLDHALDQEEKFEDYSEDDKKALGFGIEVDEDDIRKMYNNIIEAHLEETSLSNYKAFMKELGRAQYRNILEEDAKYMQVLDSLPENDPDREEKANYLFESALKN